MLFAFAVVRKDHDQDIGLDVRPFGDGGLRSLLTGTLRDEGSYYLRTNPNHQKLSPISYSYKVCLSDQIPPKNNPQKLNRPQKSLLSEYVPRTNLYTEHETPKISL